MYVFLNFDRLDKIISPTVIDQSKTYRYFPEVTGTVSPLGSCSTHEAVSGNVISASNIFPLPIHSDRENLELHTKNHLRLFLFTLT